MSDVSVTSMRRLLVVAYYFPPMGMSGVQRVAKFVKYLPEFGWEPVVLTVEPGGYFAYDEQLQEEEEAPLQPLEEGIRALLTLVVVEEPERRESDPTGVRLEEVEDDHRD